MNDDWQGVRCICGDFVVTLHAECRAMMDADDMERWERIRP